MANNSRLDIAVQIQYKEMLQQMKADFKQELAEISNSAKKAQIDADIREQIKQINKDVATMSESFEKSFKEINNQTISAKGFEDYQAKVSKEFDKMKESISGTSTQISGLKKQIGMLDASDVASKMKAQFDELSQSLLKTHGELKEVLDLTKASSGTSGAIDNSAIEEYKKTLTEINKLNNELYKSPAGNGKQLKQIISAQTTELKNQLEQYDKLKSDMASIDPKSSDYSKFEHDLVRIQVAAETAAIKITNAVGKIQADIDKGFNLDTGIESLVNRADGFAGEIGGFERKIRDIIQANKEVQKSVDQTQGTVNTFQLKDGAIHIPIDIATENGELKNKINKIIGELKDYAESKPIVAKVKLVLEGTDEKSRKKNIDFDQQQIDGQKKKSVDLASTVQKSIRDGAKIAEATVNEALATIKKEFEKVPIEIHPDADAFKKELETMVGDTFKSIAENSTGLNINEQLKELVSNLKEVSTSLSGNEGFKFGLDEASIERITNAIKDMADMMQRAFNVASNSDITAQWDVVTDKFNSATNDKGNVLKSNKVALQELAIEYKKYLDMGGKNDLTALTSHKQSIKNIEEAYESLGKTVDETTKKQEKQVKKKPESKVSNEEKEAIKGVTKENKKLEGQADKTSKALIDEGKSAETAAGKFRKLAKEKGAAVYANRELAKAAKETADALEKEAKARKSGAGKPNKNAVDADVYKSNALYWQRDIAQSLLDDGDYEEVFGAKISQASNGVVKFSALVKTASDEINGIEGEWKQFTATVDSSGGIVSPQIKEATDKQIADMEKAAKMAQKVREALANMDAKDTESTSFNRKELEDYIQTLIEAEEEADRFKIKKVELGSGGSLAITTELEEANGQVKSFVAYFDSVDDVIDVSTGAIKEFKDETTGAVKSFSDVLQENFDSGKFTTKTRDLVKEAQDLFNTFKTKNEGKSGFDSVTDDLNKLESKIKSIGNQTELDEFGQDLSKLADRIKIVTQAQRAFDKFEYANKGNSNWSEISEEVKELEDRIKGLTNQSELDKFIKDLSKLGTTLNNIGKDNKLGEVLDGNKTFANIDEVRKNIDSLFASIGKVNEKSIRVIGADKLTAEIKLTNGELHQMTVNLDSNNFARFVDNGIVQFGRLRGVAEDVFKGIQSMVRIYLSPQDFIRYFRQGFDVVKEIDTAMTELKKVSDAPSSAITAYFGDAVESAKELGSSVSDMISATADWSRLGYNLPDSRELGEVAVLYKNVGDGIDIDTANESLVSTIQGFQLQAKDAMSVIDSFNEVSNNYAISSSGIGEALKRSAAAFNAANTDLNQSIALITAGNEIVQSPEKVGTMWQTVSARIRGTKAELEELGEETDNVLSTSKLRDLVKGYTDVDIMKSANEYKDIYTIVSEIGEKWKDLKDIERANNCCPYVQKCA